jgi:hypothetical protein
MDGIRVWMRFKLHSVSTPLSSVGSKPHTKRFCKFLHENQCTLISFLRNCHKNSYRNCLEVVMNIRKENFQNHLKPKKKNLDANFYTESQFFVVINIFLNFFKKRLL